MPTFGTRSLTKHVPGEPGSFDLNGDAAVDAGDIYFFEECLTTEAGNWIGCAWADGDGSVTCADAAAFQEAWTGPGDPPPFTDCFAANCPADLNLDGYIDAGDLASLLGAWGENPAIRPTLTMTAR